MQCPNCGKEIPNDSIFCEFCGVRIKKSKTALLIILSVVLAVVIAVATIAIIKEQQERKAELARQEAARKAEAERKAEQARQKQKCYIDLGLPSGTLWKNANEGGDAALYTYDDAVSMFGNQLPTLQQLEELKDECEWTWTGRGYKVTGPNGNSIVLPAAGYRDCDGTPYGVGTCGRYRSSTNYSDYPWGLYFDSSRVGMMNYDRCSGWSVRLVQ